MFGEVARLKIDAVVTCAWFAGIGRKAFFAHVATDVYELSLTAGSFSVARFGDKVQGKLIEAGLKEAGDGIVTPVLALRPDAADVRGLVHTAHSGGAGDAMDAQRMIIGGQSESVFESLEELCTLKEQLKSWSKRTGNPEGAGTMVVAVLRRDANGAPIIMQSPTGALVTHTDANQRAELHTYLSNAYLASTSGLFPLERDAEWTGGRAKPGPAIRAGDHVVNFQLGNFAKHAAAGECSDRIDIEMAGQPVSMRVTYHAFMTRTGDAAVRQADEESGFCLTFADRVVNMSPSGLLDVSAPLQLIASKSIQTSSYQDRLYASMLSLAGKPLDAEFDFFTRGAFRKLCAFQSAHTKMFVRCLFGHRTVTVARVDSLLDAGELTLSESKEGFKEESGFTAVKQRLFEERLRWVVGHPFEALRRHRKEFAAKLQEGKRRAAEERAAAAAARQAQRDMPEAAPFPVVRKRTAPSKFQDETFVGACEQPSVRKRAKPSAKSPSATAERQAEKEISKLNTELRVRDTIIMQRSGLLANVMTRFELARRKQQGDVEPLSFGQCADGESEVLRRVSTATSSQVGFVVQDGADGPVGLSAVEHNLSRPLLVQWDDMRIEWWERDALLFESPPLNQVLGDFLAVPPAEG